MITAQASALGSGAGPGLLPQGCRWLDIFAGAELGPEEGQGRVAGRTAATDAFLQQQRAIGHVQGRMGTCVSLRVAPRVLPRRHRQRGPGGA
jgi:hypothetical protein